jgi:putative transcriptional regulator
MIDEVRELTEADFARAMPRSQRERLIRGKIRGGKDIAAFRRFVGLSQALFSEAIGISVHTLRNWEQDRRSPQGPALALIRVAARHPRVLLENLPVGARTA